MMIRVVGSHIIGAGFSCQVFRSFFCSLLRLLLRSFSCLRGCGALRHEGFRSRALFRHLGFPAEGTGLDNLLTVNGAPVILHGDYVVAGVFPFLSELDAFFRVAVVAFFVIRDQHEGCALISLVAQSIVVHAGITAAIAEGKNRAAADFLRDLTHLVHFQVFDQQSV